MAVSQLAVARLKKKSEQFAVRYNDSISMSFEWVGVGRGLKAGGATILLTMS